MAVYENLMQKLQEGHNLQEIGRNCLPEIAGKSKLLKRIDTEIKFFTKLKHNPQLLKLEYVKSSNFSHLSAILKCCLEPNDVVKILEPFYFNDTDENSRSVVVDVVSKFGGMWTKVVARNPKALMQLSLGQGKYGERSLLEQIEEMVRCASQNEYLFAAPKIRIWFAAGITQELEKCLEALPVELFVPSEVDQTITLENMTKYHVKSNQDKCCDGLSSTIIQKEMNKCSITPKVVEACVHSISVCELSLPKVPDGAALNLDVTALMVQVSNLTNGHSSAVFNVKILTEQAKKERLSPVRPIFNSLFKDRKLICCETAYRDFSKILSVVGGKEERRRAEEFLARVTVVPDNPSPKAVMLQSSVQVKENAKIIFGTGDSLKVITLSANIRFLRSAFSQGVKFATYIHEPRALTEAKEIGHL